MLLRLIICLRPIFWLFFRYEYHEEWDGQIIRRYIPALVFAPIQNTKVTLEYQHTTADSNPKDSSMLLLGIRAAF
jgi:hypothetical protein